jgi:hypothetical protein
MYLYTCCQKLLVPDPIKRLGMLSGGISDIIDSQWFSDINFDDLVQKKIKAPWKPKPMSYESEHDAAELFSTLPTEEVHESTEDWLDNICKHVAVWIVYTFLFFRVFVIAEADSARMYSHEYVSALFHLFLGVDPRCSFVTCRVCVRRDHYKHSSEEQRKAGLSESSEHEYSNMLPILLCFKSNIASFWSSISCSKGGIGM